MNRSDGFSLIEVLVASLLLMIAILGVAAMSMTAAEHLQRSGRETAMTTLAQQRIEFLRSINYTAPALNAGTTTEILTGTWVGYSRVTTVAVDAPRVGTKQVTVTATSPGGRSIQLASIIRNN